MTDLTITPGSTVVIAGFDDIPEHSFRVEEVFQDCITGTALTGPLAGEYGEPDITLVLRVLSRPT
jgi:ethanolamine utilization microcompartment shell protein EutS